MNKKLIRKLLASLLACAMLLASVAAFADDADPAADPTTAPAEQVEETETTETKTGDTETTEPEGTEPEGTDTETTDPETTDPETTDPETTDPEDTDPEEDEDADTEATEPEEDEDADTETDKPVPPPINFGGVPNVEGAEDDEDSADAENGIAPLYFHKHDHKYGEPSGNWTYAYTEYKHDVEGGHMSIAYYYDVLECEGCSDILTIYKSEAPVYETCVDADGDGKCDKCNDDVNYGDEEPLLPSKCDHANASWKLVSEKTLGYDEWFMNDGIYNVKTDKFTNMHDDKQQNKKAGHIRIVERTYTGLCEDCSPIEGEYVEVSKIEDEVIYEPHKFVNGKCACGYRQPASTTKKATDDRVRMGVKLAKELGKLAKAGATVSLYNEKLVYTEAELASVSAINNPLERALMLLAALGYGDEVDYAIKNQGLTVSAEARAIIDQIRARGVIPAGVVAFQTTAKVNGKTYDAVTISMVVGGSNGVTTKSFTFYKDGSKLYFAD